MTMMMMVTLTMMVAMILMVTRVKVQTKTSKKHKLRITILQNNVDDVDDGDVMMVMSR